MCASVVTGCDSAPVFDFGEHIFDFVSLFIEDCIVGGECLSVFLRRDAGRNAALF